MSAVCAPAVDPDELSLDLDQLYAAYVLSHLDLAWAELVLDSIAEHRDELIDAVQAYDDDDERARRVLEWLRRLPDRR
jgi:hypothetical protein